MKSFKSTFWFVFRFSITHVVTYAVCGIAFMLICGYFSIFEKDPLLSMVMKPSDALSVRLAIPFQFLRGALMGLVIYPFKSVLLQRPCGWLKLFFLLFILTSVCAVVTGPGSIEGYIYTNFHFDPLIGLPEILLQMLAFSYILSLWEGRKGI